MVAKTTKKRKSSVENKQYLKTDLKKAKFLVSSADLFGITSYNPMLDKYPDLAVVANSELLLSWFYLVAVACVGVAFMEIGPAFSSNRYSGIAYAVQKALNEWRPDSFSNMLGFTETIYKLVNSEIDMGVAVGSWVWIGLEKINSKKNRKLSLQLRKLSLKFSEVLGVLILRAFHDWWKSNE